MKVVALAGGVGGAKLVHGLAALLAPGELSIIVNTGDDFEYCGLRISPDLDTVCYTLAGLANPETGWGQHDESWTVLEAIKNLGGPDWFRLGDKDLATHLVRTDQLAKGLPLSAITQGLCRQWGVEHPVFPMSDDPVRTIVHTADHGSLGFQQYFVQHACQPVVRSFEFAGADQSAPPPGALEQINEADLVIFTPSNPWVSIDPILAVPGYRNALENKVVIAVSPLVQGQALKGPAAKMYRELGIQPGASAVANHYLDLLTGFVFDQQDEEELEKIQRWRIIPLLTNIIMKDEQDRVRFAEEVLNFGESVLDRSH
ncbi:MAG: 2-phospho-L-lactate transferase [Brevefilum sp.]|nr:2-phospho-L-lactate transferase [Brevefilum sp.]